MFHMCGTCFSLFVKVLILPQLGSRSFHIDSEIPSDLRRSESSLDAARTSAYATAEFLTSPKLTRRNWVVSESCVEMKILVSAAVLFDGSRSSASSLRSIVL